MSYKLYDFDKEVVPEELDEQIRLICDLLYNKREVYANQSAGKGFGGGLAPVPFWKRHHSVISQSSLPGVNLTGQFIGVNCSPIFTTTAINAGSTKVFDLIPLGWLNTSTTLDSISVLNVRGPGGATSVGNWTVSHFPHIHFAVKTLDSIASVEFLVGFQRASAGNVYTSLPMANGTGILDFCGFIKTTGNSNWQIHLRRGTAAAVAIDTGVAVTTNTWYALEAKWVISYNSDLQFDPATGLFSVIGYQNEVWWYINGVLVHKLLSTDLGNFPEFQSDSVNSNPQTESIIVKNKVGGAGSNKTLGCGLLYNEFFGSLPFSEIGSLAFNTFPFDNEKLYAEIGV